MCTRKLFPELPVVLEVPLTSHSLGTGSKLFNIDDPPKPAPCGFGSGASIVLCKAAFHVECPPDIGAVPAGRVTAKNVDEAAHGGVSGSADGVGIRGRISRSRFDRFSGRELACSGHR